MINLKRWLDESMDVGVKTLSERQRRPEIPHLQTNTVRVCLTSLTVSDKSQPVDSNRLTCPS